MHPPCHRPCFSSLAQELWDCTLWMSALPRACAVVTLCSQLIWPQGAALLLLVLDMHDHSSTCMTSYYWLSYTACKTLIILTMCKRLSYVTISIFACSLNPDYLQESYLRKGWSVLHRNHLGSLWKGQTLLQECQSTREHINWSDHSISSGRI